MKSIILFLLTALVLVGCATKIEAAIKRINGYHRSDGTYVKSHYRDTSNDGYSGNNANTLGWNKRVY